MNDSDRALIARALRHYADCVLRTGILQRHMPKGTMREKVRCLELADELQPTDVLTGIAPAEPVKIYQRTYAGDGSDLPFVKMLADKLNTMRCNIDTAAQAIDAMHYRLESLEKNSAEQTTPSAPTQKQGPCGVCKVGVTTSAYTTKEGWHCYCSNCHTIFKMKAPK